MYPPPRPVLPRHGMPAGGVVAVAVACSVLFGMGGCAVGAALATDPTSPAAAVETTPLDTTPAARSSAPRATISPKPKAPVIRAGTWRVPQEVKPGTWRTTGGDGCYWERLRGFSGRLSDIIANEIVEGAAVVTIKASDKGFATHGCAPWKRIGK